MNFLNINPMIWLFCLISFILGCLAFYLYSRHFIYEVLRRERRLYKKEVKKSVKFWYLKPFPLISVLKKHKDSYSAKVEKLDNSIRELTLKLENDDQEMKNLQTRVDTLTKENQRLLNLSANPVDMTSLVFGDDHRSESKKLLKVYVKTGNPSVFFSIPEADGSFYAEKGEPDSDGRKFYRINTNGGNETGELHFISGHYDQKAIENIDYYLIPVCDVENIALRNNASRIVEKEAGRVIKVYDKWVTTKKIKVKLL
jgi:hypothetical protein